MGSASSKAARRLPKEPSWPGARQPSAPSATPPTGGPPPSSSRRPEAPTGSNTTAHASETKTAEIERDARDPHFLANLSRLGPVKIDHHMQTHATRSMNNAQQLYKARVQSEEQAASTETTRNRVSASALTALLQERKKATSSAQLKAIADKFSIDLEQVQRLRFVNTLTVAEGSTKKTLDKDGVEHVTYKAAWIDASVS